MATQTLQTRDSVPDGKDPVVVFEDVSIGFDGKPVLKNISFRVAPGETRILLGPAGVGKSVLLKLANGLFRPDSGRITVFGEEVSSMRERDLFALRARIGMVFQEGALFDSLSVRDNVAFRLMEEHIPDDEIDATRGRSTSLRGAGTHHADVSGATLGRHAAAGGYCASYCYQARSAAVRLAHRRPRSHHLYHDH